MKTIQKFLILLSRNERKNAFLLLVLISIMAFLDMVGVASIFPFMSVLTSPEQIQDNYILSKMFEISSKLGVENNNQFLLALGMLVFFLLVFSLLFKAFTTYVQLRFVQMREYSISKKFIESYLNQPYAWFLNRNSADLGKTIISETAVIVGKGMKPLMDLIAKSFIALALILLLIIADPKLALIVSSFISTSYLSIYFLSQKYLNKIGIQRLENNKLRFKIVNEAFGAIKEIKFSGLEKNYFNRYSKSSKIYARTQAFSAIIAQIPRYALEIVSFGGIILLLLVLISKKGDLNQVLPIITLYAFAGYRLIPAIQQIYVSFTRLAFVMPALNELTEDFKNLQEVNFEEDHKKINFTKLIHLKNVSYKYPQAKTKTIKGVNISIPIKNTVGIIGTTGSGKTTIIDILLGLLEVQDGTFNVDGEQISRKNIRSWQRNIGYVPQDIYLSDDTIQSNIAFGVRKENINQLAVERASKVASLHEFVINECENKYMTIVGERGVRLSGGQRQRIGIARALYHDPKVLILDEATSSLDNETEEAVMKAVNFLKKDITIILIAHRLNTVKNCDIIFKLENGQITKKGSFQHMFSTIK